MPTTGVQLCIRKNTPCPLYPLRLRCQPNDL